MLLKERLALLDHAVTATERNTREHLLLHQTF
jgi:hypothetical protein